MTGETKIIQPNIVMALRGATQTAQNTAHRVLVVGQQLAAGTAVSGELTESIGNDNSWDTLYDPKSMLASMIRGFKGTLSAPLNRLTRIDAIGLDDAGAGVQATGKVTFATGIASAAGSIFVDIGSSVNHRYEVVFASSDNETAIGAALVALIAADTNRQASGVNTAGDVDITAEHKGTSGNGIGIRVTGTIPGVDIAITAMANGATNPTLTTLFDVVSDQRYQTIIYPAEWGLTTLTAFLDPRFNTNGILLDGEGIVSITDTKANMATAGNAENSAPLAIHGNVKVDDTLYKGSSIFELNYNIAAKCAAIRALRLTDGANISNFVVGEAGLDAFGGVHLSSKPYFNTPVPGLPVIPIGKGLDKTEIEDLFDNGVFVLGNNLAGDSIIMGEVVTTYKRDAASNPDLSFKLLNAVDTGSAIREFNFNNTRSSFPQARLTVELIPRIPSVTVDSYRAFLIRLYGLMSEPEFSLTRIGSSSVESFKNSIEISGDFTTGSISSEAEYPIVVQLRNINLVLKIRS